jgi:hypothetical protein
MSYLQRDEFSFLLSMVDLVCSCRKPYSIDDVNCSFCSKVFANQLACVICRCFDLNPEHRVPDFFTCLKCERISLGQENKLNFIKVHSLYMTLLRESNGILSGATQVKFLGDGEINGV